jgi:transposase InsO family protein
MVINMDETKLRKTEQLEEFLAATPLVAFSAHGQDASGDEQRYEHLSSVLKRFDHPQRNKRERGVVLAYLRHASGYSRAQATRLVKRRIDNRLAQQPLAKLYRAPAAPSVRKYTAHDIELLLEMVRAHEDVCGPAIAHLLQHAHGVYGDTRYERLAGLSISHLYNLRKRAEYQTRRVSFTKTRAVCNPIGVRKTPRPNGCAGFVRIETVHQGDLDGVKGVYHITCVDEVSQWQVQTCVQGISEAFLLPVLALVMEQFPFEILGFHSDDGSEYINGRVAKLLEKLCVEQTKSRSRHSNDNLAEAQTDLAAAQAMQHAKTELFEMFNKPRPQSALRGQGKFTTHPNSSARPSGPSHPVEQTRAGSRMSTCVIGGRFPAAWRGPCLNKNS